MDSNADSSRESRTFGHFFNDHKDHDYDDGYGHYGEHKPKRPILDFLNKLLDDHHDPYDPYDKPKRPILNLIRKLLDGGHHGDDGYDMPKRPLLNLIRGLLNKHHDGYGDPYEDKPILNLLHKLLNPHKHDSYGDPYNEDKGFLSDLFDKIPFLGNNKKPRYKVYRAPIQIVGGKYGGKHVVFKSHKDEKPKVLGVGGTRYHGGGGGRRKRHKRRRKKKPMGDFYEDFKSYERPRPAIEAHRYGGVPKVEEHRFEPPDWFHESFEMSSMRRSEEDDGGGGGGGGSSAESLKGHVMMEIMEMYDDEEKASGEKGEMAYFDEMSDEEMMDVEKGMMMESEKGGEKPMKGVMLEMMYGRPPARPTKNKRKKRPPPMMNQGEKNPMKSPNRRPEIMAHRYSNMGGNKPAPMPDVEKHSYFMEEEIMMPDMPKRKPMMMSARPMKEPGKKRPSIEMHTTMLDDDDMGKVPEMMQMDKSMEMPDVEKHTYYMGGEASMEMARSGFESRGRRDRRRNKSRRKNRKSHRRPRRPRYPPQSQMRRRMIEEFAFDPPTSKFDRNFEGIMKPLKVTSVDLSGVRIGDGRGEEFLELPPLIKHGFVEDSGEFQQVPQRRPPLIKHKRRPKPKRKRHRATNKKSRRRKNKYNRKNERGRHQNDGFRRDYDYNDYDGHDRDDGHQGVDYGGVDYGDYDSGGEVHDGFFDGGLFDGDVSGRPRPQLGKVGGTLDSGHGHGGDHIGKGHFDTAGYVHGEHDYDDGHFSDHYDDYEHHHDDDFDDSPHYEYHDVDDHSLHYEDGGGGEKHEDMKPIKHEYQGESYYSHVFPLASLASPSLLTMTAS